MEKIEDIYRYVKFIYQCYWCKQLFPIWMVSDEDWKNGVKAIRANGFGVHFTTAKTICKPCYEDFNPNPKYLTLDEYISMCIPNCRDETRAALKELWDLPSEYTEQERIEELESTWGIHWKRRK